MPVQLIILVIFAIGALFLTLAILRLRKRRLLAAGTDGTLAALFFTLGGLLAAIGLNLYTYQRLTYEQPVAELYFTRLTEGQYQVLLRTPDGRARLFAMRGDEWQLDARVLKWQGVANLLGLDAQYRLERLSGRYHDIERERAAPRSVHELAPRQGLDVWRLAERHGRWLPWVDAVYGSATYLPMEDKAAYRVTITQSGLAARPLDGAGEAAVRTWR